MWVWVWVGGGGRGRVILACFNPNTITQTQDIFSLTGAAWKHPKHPCFCILPLEFEVNIDIHKHENMKTLRLYIQTSINPQRKCLGTPDCKNMWNVLIDFIWINVQAKYFIQTILYHFKWDMALRKWPKLPPAHAANLAANSGNTVYRVDVIVNSVFEYVTMIWFYSEQYS